jgi:hypothetical protein
VDLGFGGSVDLLQKVYVDLGLGSMCIYAEEVYVGLGSGSSVDLLPGILCGSKPTKYVLI